MPQNLWEILEMLPKQKHWFYVTVIVQITYGSVAEQVKLTEIKRQACLSISGAIRNTPIAARGTLLKLSPLHLYMENEARCATYRLYNATANSLLACAMKDPNLLR